MEKPKETLETLITSSRMRELATDGKAILSTHTAYYKGRIFIYNEKGCCYELYQPKEEQDK